jgi:hypothetical protein
VAVQKLAMRASRIASSPGGRVVVGLFPDLTNQLLGGSP